MILYPEHLAILGIPFLHIEHVLIGVAIGFVIILPSMIYYVRRSRRVISSQAEEALQQAQGSQHEAHTERIKSDIIISAIEDGVVVIGKDQVIQVFNNGAATITGWPINEAENLEYHSVFKLFDNKNQPYNDNQDPFARVFITKAVYRDNNAMLVTKSGRQIPLYMSVSPLVDSRGEINAVVGVFRDVTQERAEEEQRAEFISTASHEMRTPVAAIEGYLALALNEKVSSIDTKARGFLEKAHASTRHLGQLFQDLLTSAKAEDGRLVNHPQVVEIGAFLEQMVDSLRFSAEKKGLLMEFLVGVASEGTKSTEGNKVVRPLYYASVDPDRLREVITNIFDNAVKYTDTGRITIGLTGDDAIVQFYIKDTGMGIPPEDASHLFQKFYRIDNSATRSIGGTGLGLFISRKIIELSKGRIWVESKLNEGSTFYINLPRLSTQKAAEEKATEARLTSPLES